MIKQQTLSQRSIRIRINNIVLQYYLIESVAYFKNAEIKRMNVKRQQQKKINSNWLYRSLLTYSVLLFINVNIY